MNNHSPLTRDWFRRLYTEILQVTSPPSGEQIPASCLLSGPMFAELRRLANGVERIEGGAKEAPALNRVSIVIQKPGEVPDRKGPYSRELVESALRELYSRYPGIVCIVMPGLPADCWPQHGHEYLDMVDAERCKCEVDAPRNPMCLVDHTRRVTETAGDDALDARRYRRLQILGCAVDDHHLKAGSVSRFTNLDAIVDADLKACPSRGEFVEQRSPLEPTPVIPEKLISPGLLHALKQVWKGNASAVDLDQLITLSKLKLVVATGDYRQYVVTDAGRETVGIVPSG